MVLKNVVDVESVAADGLRVAMLMAYLIRFSAGLTMYRHSVARVTAV